MSQSAAQVSDVKSGNGGSLDLRLICCMFLLSRTDICKAHSLLHAWCLQERVVALTQSHRLIVRRKYQRRHRKDVRVCLGRKICCCYCSDEVNRRRGRWLRWESLPPGMDESCTRTRRVGWCIVPARLGRFSWLVSSESISRWINAGVRECRFVDVERNAQAWNMETAHAAGAGEEA